MTELAIEFIGVKKEFDGGLVQGLAGVDLRVDKGELVAVMGPSGSGKSTLLNLMGALDFCTSGEVKMEGQSLTPAINLNEYRARRVGFIFQLHNLLPALSLAENVMLPMRAVGLPSAERKARAEDLLRRVGLERRMDFLPTKVSGGERQRAAIARSLANRPGILLGDEPTGNLDSESGAAVMDLLIDLARSEGNTMIIVTHNPDVAERMDRTLRLVDGRIVSDIRKSASSV